jgi:hypothetical protein
MVVKSDLYDEVTKIAEDYFGPAAPRFVDRLIVNHLDKRPQELKPADMPELIEWTRLTVSMLTEDKSAVKELTGRLELLRR